VNDVEAQKACYRVFAADVRRICDPVPIANFDYSVHISLKNKYIYVQTPKVACSTIKLSLISFELGRRLEIDYENPKSIHQREFSPLLTPKQVGSFSRLLQSPFLKFCFVRNPFTRVLSAYLDKIVQNKPQKKPVAELAGRDLQDPITFEEFLSCIARQSITDMDNHWRPQYFQTFQGRIRYDYIGRFEALFGDLRTVAEIISPDLVSFISERAPHRTNAQNLLRLYYSKKAQSLVRDIYRVDFEHFDYSTTLPSQSLLPGARLLALPTRYFGQVRRSHDRETAPFREGFFRPTPTGNAPKQPSRNENQVITTDPAREICYQQFLTDAGWFCNHVSSEDFSKLTHISSQNRFIYVEVPDIACPVIKRALISLELGYRFDDHGENPRSIHLRIYSPLLGPKQVGSFGRLLQSSFIKFCFVRNPYARVLSTYLDSIVGNRPEKKTISDLLGREVIDPTTFEEFLSCIAKQEIKDMDSRWRPQYFQTFQPQINYDFIGKFETLSSDLQKVAEMISQDLTPFVGDEASCGTAAEPLLHEHYTENTESLVQQIYKCDFEHFGYSMSLNGKRPPPGIPILRSAGRHLQKLFMD
jgi:dermatan 4-sulfotransferase 1